MAVSLAVGGGLANVLIASSAPLVIVARSVLGALVGLMLGLILLFGWCMIRAPYEQRDALRQLLIDGASGETVVAAIGWLRTTSVPVYDKGRSVSLADVCRALQAIGLARWLKDEWITLGLNKVIPPVEGEKGLSGADRAMYELIEHEIIEEEAVNQIGQEPIGRMSVYMTGAVSNGGVGGNSQR